MKQKIGASIALVGALLSCSIIFASCVTVHVNFPEGAVQKAASDYVEELYKAKKVEEEQIPDKSSDLRHHSRSIASLFIPQAHALDFHMNSPEIKAIQAKQKSRLSKILSYKKKGVIGETDKGTLGVKDLAAVKSGIEKTRVKKLVSDENSDREALYKEIMSSNKLDGSASTRLRTIFFQQFKSADPAGAPFKMGGSWKTK